MMGNRLAWSSFWRKQRLQWCNNATGFLTFKRHGRVKTGTTNLQLPGFSTLIEALAGVAR
jgi:hypothetical protein